MEDKKEQGRKVLLRGPENYEDWAQVIRMWLLAARVWHTVLVEPEESEMKRAQTSATGSKGQQIKATKEWQDRKVEEGKAADIILLSISEEQQKHVRQIEHPCHSSGPVAYLAQVTHLAGKFLLHCCLFALPLPCCISGTSHAPCREVLSALLPVCSAVA